MRLADPPWSDDETLVLAPRCERCGGEGEHADLDACLEAFVAWVERVTEGER